jgi:hypothetical protein
MPEVRMERVIAEDEAAWKITNWAEEHYGDLIVMGTHGYGKIRGLLMGSVIANVMHEVSCPVWTDSLANLEDERWEPGITNIVCALELTAEAIPLLRFTLELAKELGAPSRVIHSVPESRADQTNTSTSTCSRLSAFVTSMDPIR